MSAYDSRPRRIPSLSERERPDSPLEDGLETDKYFLENDNLNTISIIGTDFHDKVLAVVEPRKKIDRDRPPGHRTRETLRIPENLALAGYLLSFVNYSSSVIFFSPPPGYPKTPETLHTLEHGYPVVEVDPYRNSNRSNRYSDNRIVAPLQLQLEQRGPPLLSRETTRL